MNGLWFAVMVTGLIAAGVLTQLGWQFPTAGKVRRGLARVRSRTDLPKPS